MNKKSVLTAAATFVVGAVGGILLMMSNDAYKAVSDALGNSTSNSLAILQAQQSLMNTASAQQQAQLGKIVAETGELKKQAEGLAQKQPAPTSSSGDKKDPKAQEEAKKKEEAANQQQQEVQQQMQEMIEKMMKMLQEMQQAQSNAMQALTRG